MKRFISLLLSAVMLFSTSVFAEEATIQDYTSVLENVKTILDIPEYDEFSYNISDDRYYFNWSDEKNDNYLTVTADKDSNIYRYEVSVPEEDGEAIIDYDRAQIVADDFLKTISGENYSYYKLNTELTRKFTKSIEFTYYAYINGYRVLNGDARINVNLVSGNITSYNSWFPKYSKDVAVGAPISAEDAKKAIFADGNVELVYKEVRENDKTISKPLYTIDNFYVNAYTGELRGEEEYKAENEMTADASYDMSGGGSAKSRLTEIEIAEIEKLGNAVTKEEAVKLISDKFNISINPDEISTSYHKNEDKGYVLSFSNKNYNNELYFSGRIYPDKTIESFNYNGTKILSGYENIKNYVKHIYSAADIPTDILNKYYDEYYYCDFYNKYNGIKDTGSFLNLVFDKNYNVNEIRYKYSIAEHKPATTKLSDDEIFNIAAEKIKFEPVYAGIKDNKLRLYYRFEDEFSIDASNAELCTAYGQKYGNKDFTAYSDVAGKWYENIANTLINYGYKFETNVFDGNKAVTGKDIVEFMAHTDIITYRDYYRSDTYKDYADNPDMEISKYEMAKIMINELGLQRIAQKAEFVRPFEDVNDENIGNVAVCKAYDIAKGDNGKFNGNKIITRAEMAAMVYSYVLNR